MKNNSFSCLSGNTLKMIAAVTMLIDHIGFIFFPFEPLFRIIGRLSFPIFAFFVAVGCKYTKNKLRYFLQMAVLGVVFEVVCYFFTRTGILNIFITFALSMLVLFPLQNLKFLIIKKEKLWKILLCGILAVGGVGFCSVFCRYFPVNYKFWGCMFPVFVSIFMLPKGCEDSKFNLLDKLPFHLISTALGLLLVSYSLGNIQFYSLLTLPLLVLYSGKRGKLNLKYFFYVFYPAHLVLLYGIFMLIYA
jgi:hypothetical protein